MIIPLILVALATAAASVVAYGMNPAWARHDGGLSLILWSRTLQWPLVAMSLIACLTLITLVIGGKARIWWLVGLAPVLALFSHRFSTDPIHAYAVVEEPVFVSAADATFVADDEWIVGVVFRDVAYTYPYAELYRSPVVVQSDHAERFIIMWSAFANRATAYMVDRRLKPRELEVVSMPANALLLYNARFGEFINGLTGLTPDGQKPTGFRAPLPTHRMTWGQWKLLHPQARLMAPPRPITQRTASGPVLPYYPMPDDPLLIPVDRRIIFMPADPPQAFPSEAVTGEPRNIMVGDVPLLLARDPRNGRVVAFDRRIEPDLPGRFASNAARHRQGEWWESASASGWGVDGVAVDGPRELRGRRLSPVQVEDDLYWGVMKYWYPTLQMASETSVEPLR